MRKMAIGLAALAATAGAASAQLMMPDSTSDQVLLFSEVDGSLLDMNFIDLASQDAGTPVNAIRVEDEIWVSDQLRDKITRWSLDGTTFLGEITGGMDNIRGIEYVPATNTVYVSNAGTNNGAPGRAVVTIDVPSLAVSGHFFVGPAGTGDPFDVLFWQGELFINDIAGENIERHDLGGNWLATFHDSDGVTGVDFPEQMNSTVANTLLVAGFSTPAGVYEYDADGNQINYWEESGGRGVHELENGNILYTNGSGVHVLDRATGVFTTVISGVSGRYLEPLGEAADDCFFQIGCPADVDGDGDADVNDFFGYLDLFADQDQCADVTQDGTVDVNDFFTYLDLFEQGC